MLGLVSRVRVMFSSAFNQSTLLNLWLIEANRVVFPTWRAPVIMSALPLKSHFVISEVIILLN